MKYTIGEMLEGLTGLTCQQWGGYAFYHEPLERKFSPEQKVEYTRKANACGEEEAEKILLEYPGKRIREIAEEMEFTVKTPKTPTGGGHVIFAQYVEPKEITVFMDCVEKAEELIEKEGLQRFLPDFDLNEVLMAQNCSMESNTGTKNRFLHRQRKLNCGEDLFPTSPRSCA